MKHVKIFIKLLLAVWLLHFAAGNVTGQLPEMYNIEWRCIGPAHFGGRVTCVSGIPGDYKTYFVGTAAGGLYRTRNGGTTFSAVFDETDSPSIGAVINYYIPKGHDQNEFNILISSFDNMPLWKFKVDTKPGVHRVTWNLGEDLSLSNEDIENEMKQVTEYIRKQYRGQEASHFIKDIYELRSRITPERLSPDGSNILKRMYWLFHQVRENSDKPTRAQQKWITYLIKGAEEIRGEWNEFLDSINYKK